MSCWYKILTAESVEALAGAVNAFLDDPPQTGWRPLGGPFIEPYAHGHGNVLSMPDTGQGVTSGWVFVDFCQAMVRT